jgi:hypothetical protein
MNLAKLVMDQFSSEVAQKLATAAGVSTTQTETALGGVVPALLAALSGTATSGQSGADKVASLVRSFAEGAPGSSAGTPNLGANTLLTLFGDRTLTGLLNALSPYVGLDAESVKRLLVGALPFVLGPVARQFGGKSITGAAISSFFGQQNAAIQGALPRGLSLAGIPGLPQLGDMGRNVAGATRTASQSPDSWPLKALLTAVAIALLAFLAWRLRPGRQADVREARETAQTAVQHEVRKPVSPISDSLPDVSQVSKDLSGVYSGATAALGKVKDPASAQAALPQLDELRARLNAIKTTSDQLPTTARSTLSAITRDALPKLRDLIKTVLAIPGVGDKLQPVLNDIVNKLESFGS